MQNKPNFQKSQMNANLYNTTDYENKWQWRVRKNKPNSNPIKPNFQKAKMNITSIITKDYRKKDDFVVRINKPNFVNGQNERKLTYNKGLQKKRCFRSPKNKPNSKPIQTQTKPVLSAACPELAVALSIAEGVVEWVEWANFKKNECKLLCYRVL